MENKLTEMIRPHVLEIEKSALLGCQKAKQVMELYGMHVKCPADPAAPALCEAVFKDWQATLTNTDGE